MTADTEIGLGKIKRQTHLQWLQDLCQINAHNLNTARCQSSKQFWNKKRHIRKVKLMNWKQTARRGILETCIEAYMNLRFTSLELT
jgi:hypothetical protein